MSRIRDEPELKGSFFIDYRRRYAMQKLEKIIDWFLGGKLSRLENALMSGGVEDV